MVVAAHAAACSVAHEGVSVVRAARRVSTEVSIWRLSSADHDDLVLVRRGWEACVELRVDDRKSAAEPGGGRGSLEQVARDDLLNNSGGEVRA